MKSLKLLITILLTASFSTLRAQDSLTLEDAITIALDNNFAIRIAQNTAQQVHGSVGQSGMLPQLSATAKYGGNGKDILPESEFSVGVDLNWTLFDGMKMFATHQRLKHIDDINSIAARAEIESNISEIITTYYYIVSIKQQIKSIEQTLVVSRVRHQQTEDKYSIGSASKLDVLNAKVDYNSDSSSYLREQESMLSAKVTLNQLLGRDIHTDFLVSEEIPILENIEYSDIYAKSLEQNTALTTARLQMQMAEEQKREVNSAFMPTVKLNAGYYLYEKSDNNFNYGITATMNIFNGLTTIQNRRNAILDLQNAELAEQAALLNLETNLKTTFINYQTNRDMLELETENSETAKQNMEISLERYSLGALSALELRESQRNYLNAINRYIECLYLTKVAETRLKQLAGILNP